jgi:uncharacterized protein (DUF58 family)
MINYCAPPARMTDDRDDELAELLAEVRRIEVQSSRLVTGTLAGGYTSVFRGAGIEFDEVREYAEGDDPRTVDWNVSARMGRPYVKKFIDERELTLTFALDVSASMSTGFGVWSLRQMAARICACLALAAVRNKDKVGLIAFSDRVHKYVPPSKGLRHALRIVRDCLALPASQAPAAFGRALEYAAHVRRRRGVLFLLSDFMSSGWQREVSACARRHDLVAVRLLPPELEPPARGLVRLREPESGRTTVVDWSSRAARDTYRARVARWRQQGSDALRRAQVDVMDVPLPAVPDKDAIARPLRTFFAMRELRGAKR